jgi:O-antigen/teichoic acid export membrane protein
MITLAIVRAKAGTFSVKLNPRFCLVFLKKSYPYALLILFMAFYNRIDSVMIERILPDPLGKAQAGIYAQAFRLLDAVSMFGALVAGLLLPMFSSMIKKKEPVGSMVQLSFSLLLVPAMIVVVSTFFYDREIMELLYHSHIEDSASILGFLMIGFLGIATTYIFGTLLTANGSLKMLNLMALCGMLLNAGLNMILIPSLMARGSAISAMVTQISTALAQIGLAAAIFKLRPGLNLLVRLVVFAAAIILGAWLSRLTDNRLAGYILCVAFSVILAFGIRLINLGDMVRIIKFES